MIVHAWDLDLTFVMNEMSPHTTRNIHFYDENHNDESETVIKIAFYDENFSFVIDHQ